MRSFMPENDFKVQEYEVEIYPQSGEYLTHQIWLVGPEMTHGIQHTARLKFEEDRRGDGHVSNVGAQNFDGHFVFARIGTEYFDQIYKLLQTEDPVSFHYDYESDDDTYRGLFNVHLSTSEEPLGEGLQDESS